jgi:tetratricopeptide (TPR) repeat protein
MKGFFGSKSSRPGTAVLLTVLLAILGSVGRISAQETASPKGTGGDVSQAPHPPTEPAYRLAPLPTPIDPPGILDTPPGSFRPTTAKELIRQARDLFKDKEYQKAVDTLDRAVKLDPEMDLAYLARANALHRLGQTDLAILDITRVISKHAFSDVTYRFRAELYFSRERYADALEDLDRAVALSPDNVRLRDRRAVCLGKLGRYEEARKELSAILEIEPDFALAWVHRGAVQAWLGLWRLALEDFDHAIKIDPDTPHAYFNRGRCYFEWHRWDQALKDLSKSIEQRPLEVPAYALRARLHDIMGHPALALSDWRQVIRLKGESSQLLIDCARSLIELERYEESREILDRLVGTVPNLIVLRVVRAYDEAKLGDYRAMLSDIGSIMVLVYVERMHIWPWFRFSDGPGIALGLEQKIQADHEPMKQGVGVILRPKSGPR